MAIAPDMSGYIGKTTDWANQSRDRGNEMHDLFKSEFDKNSATAKKVTDRALDTSDTAWDWANKDRAQYDKNVPGALDTQMDFAKGYTTDSRKAANRGSAIAGQALANKTAGDKARMQLQNFGVGDPSSGSYAGLQAGIAARGAALQGAAGTKSDRDTELMGQALLDNAIQRQQVLPGQAANEAGVSMAAGNQAVNTGLATTASGASTLGTEMQHDALANDMIKEWRGATMDQANAQLAEKKLTQSESSGTGAAIGAAAGILGMVGNMAMPGAGGVASSIGGNLFSSMMSKAAKGGLIKKYADGGVVSGSEIPDYVQSFDDGGGVLPEDDEEEFVDSPDEEMGEMGAAPTPGVGEPPIASGNVVPPEASPSGGEETDDVHAMVDEGEFIIPKKVVNWKGEQFFQKLIEKAYMEMQGPKTAEPEMGPPTAMAISPPSFQSAGA